MYRLTLLDDADQTVTTQAIAQEPLYIGRAPTNDLVLASRSVSARHLAVWAAQGEIWVEDLASRNGTFRANGQRVRNTVRVRDGEVLRLGTDVRIKVEGSGVGRPSPVVLVCALDDGASYPVRGTLFTLGDGDDFDVRIPGAPSATLVLHPTGELWLGTDDGEGPIDFDEPFIVGDRRFVVRGSAMRVSATWDADRERFPYTLIARLDGPTGPRARLVEVRADREAVVDAENRAVLLYLLGRRLVDDRAAGLPATHSGWMPDDEVASGIWGRAAAGKNLNVLVTRVRAELKDQGFNPWFIEKRKGHTRISVDEVDVA